MWYKRFICWWFLAISSSPTPPLFPDTRRLRGRNPGSVRGSSGKSPQDTEVRLVQYWSVNIENWVISSRLSKEYVAIGVACFCICWQIAHICFGCSYQKHVTLKSTWLVPSKWQTQSWLLINKGSNRSGGGTRRPQPIVVNDDDYIDVERKEADICP